MRGREEWGETTVIFGKELSLLPEGDGVGVCDRFDTLGLGLPSGGIRVLGGGGDVEGRERGEQSVGWEVGSAWRKERSGKWVGMGHHRGCGNGSGGGGNHIEGGGAVRPRNESVIES